MNLSVIAIHFFLRLEINSLVREFVDKTTSMFDPFRQPIIAGTIIYEEDPILRSLIQLSCVSFSYVSLTPA
jgi:hypothetical protein